MVYLIHWSDKKPFTTNRRAPMKSKLTKLEVNRSEHTRESLTFNIWNESMWNCETKTEFVSKKHLYKNTNNSSVPCGVSCFTRWFNRMCVRGGRKKKPIAIGAVIKWCCFKAFVLSSFFSIYWQWSNLCFTSMTSLPNQLNSAMYDRCLSE